MTKKLIRNKIVEIAAMNKEELDEFAKEISISSIGRQEAGWLNEAIDLKREHLSLGYEDVELMAVSSEIKGTD